MKSLNYSFSLKNVKNRIIPYIFVVVVESGSILDELPDPYPDMFMMRLLSHYLLLLLLCPSATNYTCKVCILIPVLRIHFFFRIWIQKICIPDPDPEVYCELKSPYLVLFYRFATNCVISALYCIVDPDSYKFNFTDSDFLEGSVQYPD